MAETSQSARLDADLFGTEGEPEEPLPFRAFTRRRVIAALVVILTLVALVVVPPLFNVGRFRRQIASSISASLGRPVHINNVTLNLLPLPGFTLDGFVVGEDPAFGAEPVLRAEEVRATLRFSSLWRRRLEFSRIALTDPSINLVHLPDGRWNFESILVQAARIPAAPTAQRTAGPAPRFPYIEATGARLNLKQGVEKTPYSLTEGDLALWLSDPGAWRVRIKAHPTRTDTAVSDTGLIRMEGRLGQAASLAAVPLHLDVDWTSAPLGALSQILMARDLGMRGTLDLHATLDGTAGRSDLQSRVEFLNVRRADFVPRHSLSGAVQCSARLIEMFHSVDAAHCVWPGEVDGTGVIVDLRVPDLQQPSSATGTVTLGNVPAELLLDGARVLSNRISPDLTITGLVSGALPCCGVPAEPPAGLPSVTVMNAAMGLEGEPPFARQTIAANLLPGPDGTAALRIAPILLDLGAPRPTSLNVTLSRAGADLSLTGDALPARLRALARALPQFGDGLAPYLPEAASTETVHLDLLGQHGWTSGQTWQAAPAPAPVAHRGPARHRHGR